jgi:hypothetical protein
MSKPISTNIVPLIGRLDAENALSFSLHRINGNRLSDSRQTMPPMWCLVRKRSLCDIIDEALLIADEIASVCEQESGDKNNNSSRGA